MSGSRAIVVALLGIAQASAYKAAYVEYTASSPCGGGSCGRQQKAASCAAYAQYISEASNQGADIIVFPEYGITGFSSYPKWSWVSGGYTETIPAPSGRVVPCDDSSSYPDAPSVVSLSCAAKQHGIAVVANLMAYDGTNMYNTDIALDTDGTLLAVYHKLNLWGESNVDVPPDCPIASFATSFGVTFGMITCADLIYAYPAQTLVSQHGISHFVMPAAWSNEMAQMQVMGFAQAWSLRHNTTLILANQRTSGESGSGVWRGGVPLAYTYTTAMTPSGRLVVADISAAAAGEMAIQPVPIASANIAPVEAMRAPAIKTKMIDAKLPHALPAVLPAVVPAVVPAVEDRPTDAPTSFVTARHAVSGHPIDGHTYDGHAVAGRTYDGHAVAGRTYDGHAVAGRTPTDHAMRARGSGWMFGRLSAGRVCSGGVCCTAQVTSGSGGGFVLAALDGEDSDDGETWAAQVCAVLPCDQPSAACLSYAQPSSMSLSGVLVTMAGAASATTVFPEVIATASGVEQRMLTPFGRGGGADGFAFDAAATSLNVTVSEGGLSSVTLYGRRFQADRLAYSC